MLSRISSRVSRLNVAAPVQLGAIRQKGTFNWEDPFDLRSQLNEEERTLMDQTREYAAAKLLPRVTEAYRHEKFDKSLIPEMGKMGLLGAPYEGYGCAGTTTVGYGLIARYIPALAAGENIGCFGLTEPNHGSNPNGMETRARWDEKTKTYKITGTKTWISNSPVADICIVWARSDRY